MAPLRDASGGRCTGGPNMGSPTHLLSCLQGANLERRLGGHGGGWKGKRTVRECSSLTALVSRLRTKGGSEEASKLRRRHNKHYLFRLPRKGDCSGLHLRRERARAVSRRGGRCADQVYMCRLYRCRLNGVTYPPVQSVLTTVCSVHGQLPVYNL